MANAKFNAALIRKLLGDVSWGRIRLPIRYVPDTAGTPLFNVFNVPDLLHATANIISLPFKKRYCTQIFLDAAMIEPESRLTNSEVSPFELEAQDEDYDIYLFWPSLNSGTATFEKPVVATHQRHLSPLFDPVDSYAGWDTAPSSPLSLAPPPDFRFPRPLENDRATETEASKVQEKGTRDPLPMYSSMFKMGLLLTRAARQHVDRAVQSVGDKLRNAKATRRSAGRTYTFDP